MFPKLAAALVGLLAIAAAQAPRLDDVIGRLDLYLADYWNQLATVVAEETYRQSVEQGPSSHRSTSYRTLRSDYALTRTDDRHAWVGYRDTFEIDGRPVRDREERLERMLRSGELTQAKRIAEQNARFNLGEELIARNVNVPTFALEMMHPSVRSHFSRSRAGADTLNARPGWLVEFQERDRPTLVRTPEGRDQASRIVALIATESGEVLRTTMTWEHVKGTITVTYGRVPAIPVLVPIRMEERYTTRTGAHLTGDATYANYRQFQTSGRLLENGK